MKVKSSVKLSVIFVFIFVLGVLTLYSQAQSANSYLGVLADGYPSGLVANEFKFANAQLVSIKGNVILFSINENTKLTTFMKNLPFLKEVYVDPTHIKGDSPLRKHPLTGRFITLLKKQEFQRKHVARKQAAMHGKNSRGVKAGNPVEKPAMSGNMKLIHRLITNKAKQVRDTKTTPRK